MLPSWTARWSGALSVGLLNFSTWRGVHGIYLEDLFGQPRDQQCAPASARPSSSHLPRNASPSGDERLEAGSWSLDWNTPAIDFYESLGALPQDEWTTYRLTDEALTGLGSGTE